MKKSVLLLLLLALGVMALYLDGCASSAPSRFYSLSPVKDMSSEKHTTSAGGGAVVAVGPLTIPDYLDRPQIVTRSSRNELDVDEFHRWAGSLENDITRVLIEDLSAVLSPHGYSVIRWVPVAQPDAGSDCRVAVDIVRFDGTRGDSVRVKAQWSVFRCGRSAPEMHESDIVEQVKGDDYNSLVEAMSRAAEGLSRDIADAIQARK